ncbi:MAG: FAD-dependent oxidoreductase [Planctomycetes bacterium]|nr:FAD-dependent oxidoreductase [Planctomycetota bacterium]
MTLRFLYGVAVLLAVSGCRSAATSYDVVVYGGTSGGVVAAVKVARMGKSVVLIEPGRHLGGLSSGGLGATDIGNKQAIGGMSREFYRQLGKIYDKDEAWKFEPHVAEQVFNEMICQANVRVVFAERLNLANGLKKEGTRIRAIIMESGRTFRGRMFIDATYEGDLMAKAGVSYHVGREANAVYDETLNGVQTRHATHHQFIKPVDPYVVPGDPSSGLLPGVHAGGPGIEGGGDHRVQAYNFRICATDAPENRRPWPKPDDYDPLRYELLLRNFEAGDERIPWHAVMMPNRKTDSNNNHAVSTDYIGMNYDYPDGDYATRARIIREHESYQMGLMWTLANNPRVPEKVGEYFQTWGLAKDEFTDNDNWPRQLYVREARRMVSDYVMTQHNCQGRRVTEDPVGLAAYTMDSHNVQRYVDENGHVRNEGDVQVGGFPPYPISYRAIVPQRAQCTNLLVPVCLSASHIAFGSIRMEPVFMVLGESAATAAVQALDADVDVQAIDYEELSKRLAADGQVLGWPPASRSAPE